MDEELNGVVNYVFVVRKSPLLLGLCILFTALAIRSYNEWAKLEELSESEES
jgi:hypothetical protein